MSDMKNVDAFLAKTDELIEEVETKFPGVRHVRTPQGLRRYSDAIGTPIEVNKPDKPDKPKTPARVPHPNALPAHKPLKPKHSAAPGAPEPIKASTKKTKLPPKLVEALKRLSPRGTPDGAGTPDDPIDVGDDIALAAKHLSDGKSIRMKDNHAVSTLVSELARIGNEARAKGEKAPNYDLCKVSVPGTNLFCYENKGIPRAEMPQFKGEAVPGSLADSKRKTDALDEEVDVEDEYRAALDAMGVKITPKTVKASELKATQSELVGTKVAGMADAMEAGKIKDAPIFVTRDGYIIDGHHRWAAKVALDLKDGVLGDVEMPVNEIDMEIGEAIDFANLFAKIVGLAPKAAKTATTDGKKSLVDDCPSGACGWNEDTLLDAYMQKVEKVISTPTQEVKFAASQPRDFRGRWVKLPGSSAHSKVGVWELTDGTHGVFVDGKETPKSVHRSKDAAKAEMDKIVASDKPQGGFDAASATDAQLQNLVQRRSTHADVRRKAQSELNRRQGRGTRSNETESDARARVHNEMTPVQKRELDALSDDQARAYMDARIGGQGHAAAMTTASKPVATRPMQRAGDPLRDESIARAGDAARTSDPLDQAIAIRDATNLAREANRADARARRERQRREGMAQIGTSPMAYNSPLAEAANPFINSIADFGVQNRNWDAVKTSDSISRFIADVRATADPVTNVRKSRNFQRKMAEQRANFPDEKTFNDTIAWLKAVEQTYLKIADAAGRVRH